MAIPDDRRSYDAEDLWANLCQDSHADPRALMRLLDPETNVISLEPKRTAATRSSLLMHAGLARDQSMAIATFAGIELQGLDDLDAAIESRMQRLSEDVDAAEVNNAAAANGDGQDDSPASLQ
jgi:hypothetical protein